MMMEEAAELIVALNKYDRGEIQAPDVVEELVDTAVMVTQMRLYFDPDSRYWDAKRSEKLRRLSYRLEMEEAKK